MTLILLLVRLYGLQLTVAGMGHEKIEGKSAISLSSRTVAIRRKVLKPIDESKSILGSNQ